jgi:hypothetical protein
MAEWGTSLYDISPMLMRWESRGFAVGRIKRVGSRSTEDLRVSPQRVPVRILAKP